MKDDSLGSVSAAPAVAPPLDPGFRPAALINRRLREDFRKANPSPLRFGLERPDGSVSVYDTIVASASSPPAPVSLPYAERILKFLLWQKGGWKVHIGGPTEIGHYLQELYREGGDRQFDYRYMSDLYQRPFTLAICKPDQVPVPRERELALGRHLDGCRVGFDLGASDRKASAVIEGRPVFSEEVLWDPRNAADPEYHYREIMDSIRRAASALPRLDAVGGSAAGVYMDNRVRAASLFRGVPHDLFEEKVAGLFLRIRDELGVPLEVINDGEVTALAGSMSLGANPVLGIAMGSSEAAGYVCPSGSLTTWLNELAFTPIDYRPDAPVDEWSGDRGCGVQYLSQVGAIRVAESAGLSFPAGLALPEKLLVLQERMASGDEPCRLVYETLGAYLGYAVAHYADFYHLKDVLVLGRVTSGRGGEVIVEKAQEVLRLEFPDLGEVISIALPDEKSRRVGQAIAAASLPRIEGI